MSDAEDMRAQLDQLRSLMRQTVANGAGAVGNTKDTITDLTFASEQLQGARTYAAQQLEVLIAMDDQFELILEGSLNADLVNAQGKLKSVIKEVQDFINRTQYHINNIDKIRSIVKIQMLPMVENPGVILNQINEIIEQWARYL